jgi:TolB-like protein
MTKNGYHRKECIHAKRASTAVLLGIMALCVSIPAFAQDAQKKPRIAVLPLKAVDVSAAVVQSVTSLIETALVRTKAYTVVSTTDRDQVLKAQETALAGCDDEACAIQIGRLLAAQHIVVGNVSTLGKKFIINARIIDISTSQIVGAESVSAMNVEDLEDACTKLTQALVASALPTVKIAQAAEPPKVTKPAETKPAVKEPEAAKKPVEPAAEPQAQPAAGFVMPDILGLAVMSGGILFMEAGNTFGVMGFESMRKSEVLYGQYMAATGDFDALYAAYTSAQGGSAIFGISSYSLLGLGAAGISTSVFLLPPDAYRLSLMGKIAYSAGLACSVSGSVLALMAGNQEYAIGPLYDAYMNADADFDALYQQYRSGYTAYSLERIFGYSLWGLGGIAMAGSFFLPGEKAPMADSLWNKILFAGGTALVSGGGFTQSMALNVRQLSEERYKAYMNATTGFDALYADYSASHGNYVLLSALSYGLLASGAAAVITSLFVPLGSPSAQASAELPVILSLIPLPDGIGIFMHITPRRS